MRQLLDRIDFRIGPTTVAFVKSTNDDRLWCAHTMRFSSFRRLCVQQKTKIAWCVPGLIKLGTHHAIFVGTTIVVRRDDGRRSSNDPHTPRDDRRMTRTHHATAVGCTHDGRQQLKQIANLADIRLSANANISSAASDVATYQQEII